EIRERQQDGKDAVLDLEIPQHLDQLESAIKDTKARLVIIDPLFAYLADVDTHRDTEVRRVLKRLREVAERWACAIIIVRHFTNRPGGKAIHRGGGSVGIIGHARVGLIVTKDPDDEERRVLAVAKNNVAAKAPSQAYRLVPTDAGVCTVEWCGTSEYDAD